MATDADREFFGVVDTLVARAECANSDDLERVTIRMLGVLAIELRRGTAVLEKIAVEIADLRGNVL